MQDVNVVVVFYSRTGSTERLALAAAVGAVQGRALIRLRRLPDSADEADIGSDPEWKRNLVRMNKEFIALREKPMLFGPTQSSWEHLPAAMRSQRNLGGISNHLIFCARREGWRAKSVRRSRRGRRPARCTRR